MGLDVLIVDTTGNKGTTAFHIYELYNNLWYKVSSTVSHAGRPIFILQHIGLVLSCQIQDDLSLYYNTAVYICL